MILGCFGVRRKCMVGLLRRFALFRLFENFKRERIALGCNLFGVLIINLLVVNRENNNITLIIERVIIL